MRQTFFEMKGKNIMNIVSFNINNGGTISIHQEKHDKPVKVNSSNSGTTYISAADFVSMLNWYRYQKDNGNERLEF